MGKNIFMLGSMLPDANLYRFAKGPLNKLIVTLGFRRKNGATENFVLNQKRKIYFNMDIYVEFCLNWLILGNYV